MVDGLDMLAQRRGTRSRDMPKPRHQPPPRKKRDEVADRGSATHEQVPTETPATQARPAAPSSPAEDPATAPAGASGRSVAPSTIYFDEESDDWLEEACSAGRRGRPKLNSRSAFARLAVRLLREQMTPEEAVQYLRNEAAAKPSARPGRPRL